MGPGRSPIKRARVLLISGKEALRAGVASALEEAGFQVTHVPDGYQGLRSVYEASPDLVIMAEDLPPAGGAQVCSRLRQVSHLPIIVLGSGGTKGTGEIEMLEVGADAYMPKPPNPAELVARVRSLLRRKRPDRDGRGGDSGSVPEQGTARRRNGSGDLTSTESSLLSCLVLNEGRVVSHSQLVSEVWAGKQVSRDCLKFYVRRLRDKLSGVLGGPGYILNHRGVGYRFSRTM
ncbi:MAG: response regulator transcription factor [Chloroflexi bacterium]|nr:response regulator transcription factor [Chloroflexota bacterium]